MELEPKATSLKVVKPKYVPKPKTPEQLDAWKTFCQRVRDGTTARDLLHAALLYELADRAQGSFAFNRAKKFMQSINHITEPKLCNMTYRDLGESKVDFYLNFQAVEPQYLAALRHALLTPTAALGKRKILYGAGGVMQLEDSPEAVPNLKSKRKIIKLKKGRYEQGNNSDSADDLMKRLSNIKFKLISPREPQPSISSAMPEARGADVSSSAEVCSETVRSIRAARLAEAITHPAFNVLSKKQQDAVRGQWVNSLLL